MSLTPLDGRQQDRAEAVRDGASAESLRSRLRARIGDLLARVPLARRLVGADGDADRPTATAPVPTDRSPEHSARVLVEDLPQRDRPFVTPARRAGDRNPVELDVSEGDDGLTLSLADNPDATITSDTYQRVER
ncbi:hypothetical protein ACFQL1_01940 [Halomicroarcula sp. GCM10025709]|uniref:hypothetical protein n=1 Tax=Haloarcula TaxID=2237 RepID=UPI0024C363D4|nr:hypothetical protein [Halomicroarcula sp. YJ-61-S]